MDTNDEKFFAELVGAKTDADDEYEVELAKASTGAVVARSKTASKRDDAGEPSWDNDEPAGQLTVDVYQTPEDIVIQSAIAGVKPEDIDISATPDAITIRGWRARTSPRACSSALVYAAPVGLLGLLINNSLLRGVMAASSCAGVIL